MHKTHILLTLLTVAVAAVVGIDFESFKKTFGKSYPSQAHHDKAKSHFEANKARIEAHNKEYEKGNVKQKLALNQYADMDQATFHSTRHGLKLNIAGRNRSSRNVEAKQPQRFSRQAPPSFDWRNGPNGNMVSPVRNQNPCGDCWAFSAMGAIESQMLMAGKQMVLLSEEQLVDCDTQSGGCNGGGSPDQAFSFLQNNGGAMSDSSYPYTAGQQGSPNYGQTGQCQFNAAQVVTQVTGMQSVSMPTDPGTLQAALVNNGPQSLGVDASQWDSQYSEGYVTCPTNPSPDHAILLVGYGTDNNGNNYWIIKNNWDTSWGQQGFGMIEAGAQDCGVTQFLAVNPTIK